MRYKRRKDLFKQTPKKILTSWKCEQEEEGKIPVTGELQHLEGWTYFTKLKRKTKDGTKYLLFMMDGRYYKLVKRLTSIEFTKLLTT